MEKKLSKKKIIWLCVLGVVILAMLAAVLYYIFKPDPGIEVEVVNPEVRDVIETYDTTGTVKAGSEGVFELIDGVMPTKVNVKVGDIVKKGQVIVEFDSSELKTLLNEKKEAYDKAKTALDDYKKQMSVAEKALDASDKEVSNAEKVVAKLEKEVESEKNNKTSDVNAQDIKDVQDQLTQLTDDSSLAAKIVKWFAGSDTSIGKLKKALDNISEQMSSVDLSGLLSYVDSDSAQGKLIQAQLQLANLKINNLLLENQAKGSLISLYKSLFQYAEKAYNDIKDTVNEFESGWIAENDGIVSEVNIKAGERNTTDSSAGFDISSILSSITSGNTPDISSMLSGLTGSSKKDAVKVQYYPFKADFVINQGDLQNISVGKPVKVTSVTGTELTGKVTYISAVATTTSGLDINSIMGGSSSSTGVEASVEIDTPDKGVIIGLDVDISIDVRKSENTITVPVESIQYDTDNSFVYVLKDGKLVKTIVEIGLFDGSYYEIKSGLTSSDEIVKVPVSSMEDGMKAHKTEAK